MIKRKKNKNLLRRQMVIKIINRNQNKRKLMLRDRKKLIRKSNLTSIVVTNIN